MTPPRAPVAPATRISSLLVCGRFGQWGQIRLIGLVVNVAALLDQSSLTPLLLFLSTAFSPARYTTPLHATAPARRTRCRRGWSRPPHRASIARDAAQRRRIRSRGRTSP